MIAGGAGALQSYVERLAARAPLGDPADQAAAVSMLVSAIVADALGRHDRPGGHAVPAAGAPGRYARAFLPALGWAPTGHGKPVRWEWGGRATRRRMREANRKGPVEIAAVLDDLALAPPDPRATALSLALAVALRAAPALWSYVTLQ